MLPSLIDPKTGKVIRVPGEKLIQISRSEAEELGLTHFIPGETGSARPRQGGKKSGRGGVAIRYPDGELYLVLDRKKLRPYRKDRPGLLIVDSPLDFGVFGRHDPLLPPIPPDPADPDPSAPKSPPTSGVNVIYFDGDGDGDGVERRTAMKDPRTDREIQVAGNKAIEISRLQAEAMGLGPFIPVPRQISVVDEALMAKGQALEVIQQLLPELFKEIMRIKRGRK